MDAGILKPPAVLKMSDEQLLTAENQLREGERETQAVVSEAATRTLAEAEGRVIPANSNIRYAAQESVANIKDAPYVSSLPPQIKLYQRPRFA